MRHNPVLLKEIISAMELKQGAIFVDCNLGDGGHSEEVLKKLNGEVKIIGFDLDIEAIERAKSNLECTGLLKTDADHENSKGNFNPIKDNFRNLDKYVQPESADAVLFDLGLSSYELDESNRGFSFKKAEPLSMTFGEAKDAKFTAYDMVNGWDRENLTTIIQSYGEEKFAWRIAGGIVEARQTGKIENTAQLAEIIKKSVPVFYRIGRIHPATKTFQAIRITVNDELGSLEEALPKAFAALKKDGKLLVISYHSLEDRIVKRFMKDLSEKDEGKIETKKPMVPTDEEIRTNPRSRSAKLRIIKKI